MILWGPPGCGKTSLARLVARRSGLPFVQFSAVTSGIKEVKEAVDQARWRRQNDGKSTLLFVDEIHRFNRAQQDALLPHVERGTLTLIGATTENPSFEVNAALLSRCRVFVLQALSKDQVLALLRKASERLSATPGPGALEALAELSGGDARRALNVLEMCGMQVTLEAVREMAQRRDLRYDKDRDQHYDIVSAFIKSMRGSDPDAALYWMARMLEAGEDPLFVARRLVIFASEDVGNADPRALMLAVAAKDAVHFTGMPEGFYMLSQACTYLATAPKSNASGQAYLAAKADVEARPDEPVPLHLRNAATSLMKDLGYGKGYEYAHDRPGGIVSHGHRPPFLEGRVYYAPGDRGYEITIRKLMEERKRPAK
jgi:putative ATPase